MNVGCFGHRHFGLGRFGLGRFSVFLMIKHSINTSMMKTFIVPHLPHLPQYYTLFFKLYLHVNNKDTPKI